MEVVVGEAVVEIILEPEEQVAMVDYMEAVVVAVEAVLHLDRAVMEQTEL
mgnify:CR=1 FL=1